MNPISLLEDTVINQIAAGEVIERPAAVVKELVENSIDANATAITVEIKEGGLSFIRITDNGTGIPADQMSQAFLRHATSKIQHAEDLHSIHSLGFRGEALASIAAVSMVEAISRTREEISGIRYLIEGGKEQGKEEIGCPEGTTFLIRNIFYNTPARKKFMKSAATESAAIAENMQRLALSHPEVAIKFMNQNQVKLQTTGNNEIKSLLYSIYGREIATHLIPIEKITSEFTLRGFLGDPTISRGNRAMENYFLNGRLFRDKVISQALEDAYKPFLMGHRYPFVCLYLEVPANQVDVNVHPAKWEVRFAKPEGIYQGISLAVSDALKGKEFIPGTKLQEGKEEKAQGVQAYTKSFSTPSLVRENQKIMPEPFEQNRKKELQNSEIGKALRAYTKEPLPFVTPKEPPKTTEKEEQQSLFRPQLLSPEPEDKYRIIGSLFRTYWLIEMDQKLYFLDQHAAHEKIRYEKALKAFTESTFQGQQMNPPLIITLTPQEEEALTRYESLLTSMAFEIAPFGGHEYQVRQIPLLMDGLEEKDLLVAWIGELAESLGKETLTSETILAKLASYSCKGAVKGNHSLSFLEVSSLMKQLMELEDPYHCPHGRPVLVSLDQREIEKMFKRIL